MGRIDREDGRRNQLIEATIDTMAEVGFSATTLALIGQRAGISPGLVAHYFRDKDGLLEATRDLDDGTRRINSAMHSADVWAAENSAHALVTYVLAGQPATDDVAVLVAEFGPSD